MHTAVLIPAAAALRRTSANASGWASALPDSSDVPRRNVWNKGARGVSFRPAASM
ncbi:hypothetical protein [Rhizobium ruizarguesonis]|uniref:hypothetical protein n=1 Tax=Rhizobium ruizarguesonis TaxID=2081791 RepID=UPI0013C179BB|nr:hypothetical protein [Rhizobium ruizarguesonis]NEI96393.1 hypothetical protein [Rhizobium ruizarguesonis]NEJ33984.1 hypothetical protein [Rhizobium ruizarguesonis]